MTLRTRIAVAAASAVALAVLLASLGLYAATARTLQGSVDRSLTELADQPGPGPAGAGFHGGPRPGRFGGAGGTVQVVDADGQVLRSASRVADRLPVTDLARGIAAGGRDAAFQTVEVGDARVRILTVPAGNGLAVQVARPLGEVDAVLGRLRGQLLVAGLLGIGLAALLGMLVSRRAVRPVEELTRLAEDVATTQDLSRRIASGRPGGQADGQTDEIGRLADAFDRMLAQLEQARHAQEQLVADASHELRTPLTSLRTNVEVLAQLERLDLDERQHLVDDVVVQIDEFADLVGGLVELARGERPVQHPVPVALDAVVAAAVERFARAGREVVVDATPSVVLGDAERLERLVGNLLENAGKYAPTGRIEVRVGGGCVEVRDHGPGIAPADLPHVFERFYRAAGARSAPGSGLGLSIVRQIAEAHGGRVEATDAPGGGALLRFVLPEHAGTPTATNQP